MASQNSWTPPGTPVEVTLAFRKKASAMTMTPASAEAITVSPLIVKPNQCQIGAWWPTSIAASATMCSVISGSVLQLSVVGYGCLGVGSRIFGAFICALAQLLQNRQRGAQHQDDLEQRQT